MKILEQKKLRWAIAHFVDWARLLGVQALGRRWRARSAGGRASGRRCGRARARAGSGMAGRAGAQAGRSRRGRAGRWAWALGARPGRLGWPWAVHSVHWAHFRSVLTRYFFLSHQMNTVHCKIKFFFKKKIFFLLNSNKIK